jgi:2,3-bisphosphoglycerate-dependent phosphoglycerate mutase
VQLLLIRHGESVNNLVYRDSGGELDGLVADPQLTDLGQRQAAKLAAFFAAGRLPLPTVLYSSLMRRAVETAAPLADVLDMPVQGWIDLHEVAVDSDGPAGATQPDPGLPASQLKQLCPSLVVPEGADEAGWYHADFETPLVAWQRAQRVAQAIMLGPYDEDAVVAVVAHGWFCQYLLRSFTVHPPYEDGWLQSWWRMYNTSTILLEYPGHFPGEAADVQWVNRFDHLDDDELTV